MYLASSRYTLSLFTIVERNVKMMICSFYIVLYCVPFWNLIIICLCLYYIDLEDVIRKICTRKLKGASLKAEKVHHSDAILVQGLSFFLIFNHLVYKTKRETGFVNFEMIWDWKRANCGLFFLKSEIKSRNILRWSILPQGWIVICFIF